MTINRIDIAAASFVVLLSIYLFAQAPVPISNEHEKKGEKIHVNILFEVVAAENNKARKLWTKQIVVNGNKSGLKFGEDWHKVNVDKGPLPALFLRKTASLLEKSPVPLSLFLGSDFPISSSNKFKGRQADFFTKMRQTGNNQFFYDDDVQRYTAMFPDKVVVKACSRCHNEHPKTPKDDWQMRDIMGATTWAYPHEYVTRDELSVVITELRKAFNKAYIAYLDKVATFKNKPNVGNKWPVDGYFLPSAKVFLSRLEATVARDTLAVLLQKADGEIGENKNAPLSAKRTVLE
ncbi:hypothetical protein MNBD_GAMMA23-2508 [hydrothermal vent metagenome]|uniref:Tll0287-like domain-containing protein n=1 Tax=hydrothermal vent metagenome TaxID=652676 RepID=A0A3B0ZWA9_9ZZZZ